MDALGKGKGNGVCMVGLYKIGGIGKTSICKALCNKYFIEFHGSICHVELGKGSEEELMREVVNKLTRSSHIDGFKKDQVYIM